MRDDLNLLQQIGSIFQLVQYACYVECVHQIIFSGDLDHIVPAPFGHAYAKKAKNAGDRVDDIEIKGAGHFEMIDPKSAAWPTIEAAIVAAAK